MWKLFNIKPILCTDIMDEEYTDIGYGQEISEEPPEFSIGNLITTFREKGIINALNDEAMGPHTHLFLLLTLVFFLAIIIGIAQLAFL